MWKILIADDEAMEQQGLKMLIQRRQLPVEILLASDGEEALAITRTKKIDILITDVRMPKMNGLELCKNIRESDEQMYIIVQSAYDDFDYMRQAIQMHVDDYILKPIVLTEFDTALNHALRALEERSDGADGSAVSREEYIVSEVMQIIEEHFSEGIGLEWIAEQVGLSSGYLSSLFKSVKNQGLTQYLITFRMEKAKELLCHTKMRVADIGKNVGYPNASYFCQQFRKYFGVTANAMRENYRK